MRLLERKPEGELVFSEYTGKDVRIPPYAILSHTWAMDNCEEVTFQDVKSGTAKSKPGYKKIQFCAQRAAADGLRYFWIDTCCIDKSNSTELSRALNSMFRWYQKAARCYVYLSDVSILDNDGNRQNQRPEWEAAFRKSRWFTRGWTLQEFLAPTLVDFYGVEGERLGSKSSLEEMIHNITGISRPALKGQQLSDFSVQERMSWAERRNTKEEEDEVYSLLGIFDVSMPPIYGEGREKAFRRLQDEINKYYKGLDFEQFTVNTTLSAIPEPAQFVGREKELAEMHQLLYGHTIRSIVVLHGLGGIGKTQLAIAYTMRHKDKYTAILWLNANDEDSLKLSFLDIAQQVQREHPTSNAFAGVDLENLDDVVSTVKAWLSLRENSHWLMIYDNYDNPKLPGNPDQLAVDVRRFLPTPNHGSIIITTRSSQVTIGRRIQVQKLLDVQEGLEILSNMSGRKGILDDPAAIALVRELDGLPLALSTAGAYLEQVATSFSEYHRLYKVSWLKLQMTSPQLNSYENRTLYTTWQISLDQIERQNILSTKLLKLWAYFDRQDVWFELLRHGSSDSDWIQELTKDEITFNAAVRLLCNYGLVDADPSLRERFGTSGYSMHSCVHSWTEFVLNKECDQGLTRLALTCIASKIPSDDEKNWWLLERRLLQHATRYERFIMDGKVKTEGIEWSLSYLGDLYRHQGKLTEAEAMYTRALQGYEETLGPKHISTLHSVNGLGILYTIQGKLAKAEAMHTRALQGMEEVLGPKHTSTLWVLNDLGNLYRIQDNLAEAEKMYSRALRGKEEALGPKHTSTLTTVNNLAILYKDQGKLTEAEAMYTRALQGYEETLGPKHTSILHSVNGLGILYTIQGKLAEAEAMYTRALQEWEEALGPKHISTLSTVHNLGNLYADHGKLAEAEALYTRALQGKEEAFGPKHTSTLNTVCGLGELYRMQYRLAEADIMTRRALTGYEDALGSKHTSTLEAINDLGRLFKDQGKLADAEKMYNRALQGFEEALGLELMCSCIPALNTLLNLGDLFSETYRKDMAKAMYARALSGYTIVRGPSSDICRDLKDRLQALELAPAESRTYQDTSTETRA